ncbi:peroxide stress protein YaaA [Labedella phragmitis]|uniref:Peroxide stress protein YaaA n=1 Tax=Labedella phragmitis TaxID=2498849 RepID=A0A3S3YWE9_9MICO|nr:peroxide stress protein YaaA [Labedella phragmitis]RWZ46572.1 peroxide stress protein YaaA [Labedella phragmitis]
MLLLLPPSETKVQGGTGRSLLLRQLSFPELTAVRSRVLNAVVELSRDPEAAIRALKLGPKGHGEVAINRAVRRSATLPAIDRYTGVLYDALDARSLSPEARRFAEDHVVIQSALFGPVGALDPVPGYRLSHSSRLPGLRLTPTWAEAAGPVLERVDGLIVDLRSEGYAELGPVRASDRVAYIRVVAVDDEGRRRALNHFNKKTKGLFTRAVLESGQDFGDIEELAAWAAGAGFSLGPGSAAGEWDLVVPEVALPPTGSTTGARTSSPIG